MTKTLLVTAVVVVGSGFLALADKSLRLRVKPL